MAIQMLIFALSVASPLPPASTPEALRQTMLHLGPEASGSNAAPVAAPGVLFAQSNGTVRAANATDGGARRYCWDCGGCGAGDLVKLWPCNADGDAAQTWTTHPAVPAVGEAQPRWALFASGAGAVVGSNCLAAHSDGRLELRVQKCNASDIGQHWSGGLAPQPTPPSGVVSRGAAVFSRRFPSRSVNGSYIDPTGVAGGYLLWPKPQRVELPGAGAVELALMPHTFHFVAGAGGGASLLARAFARYTTWIFANASTAQDGAARSAAPSLTALHVLCDAAAGDEAACTDQASLNARSDESYELRVVRPPGRSSLSARSVWGVLRGLETFSQMVERPAAGGGGNGTASGGGGDSGERRLSAVPVSVFDAPRFAYRGLLVDSARHYMPLSVLRAHIDALSWSKMNVMHWHHHDAGVWSLHSDSVPGLADAAVAAGWQYSHAEVKDLVSYARDRGVRIIPEFETPGHANSLYKAVPNMSSICYGDYKRKWPIRGEMNPCLDVTHETLTKLLSEFAPLFDDEIVHLGGDEVSYNCWGQDKSVKPGCRGGPANETTYSQLEQRFDVQLHGVLRGVHKKPMHWHDPLTERSVNLSLSSLIEVWDGTKHAALATTLSRGYEAVFSGSYYLDHLQLNWEDYYAADPTTWTEFKALAPAARARLIGLEASMWSETVDHTNAITKTWPRAAAVAERAWSSSNNTMPVDGSLNSGYVPGPARNRASSPSVSAGHQDSVGLLKRLHAHRCRMLERGVNAAPGHFGQAVGLMGTMQLSRQGLCPQDVAPPL